MLEIVGGGPNVGKLGKGVGVALTLQATARLIDKRPNTMVPNGCLCMFIFPLHYPDLSVSVFLVPELP